MVMGISLLLLLALHSVEAASLKEMNLFDIRHPLETFKEKKPQCWWIMRGFDIQNVQKYFREDSVVTLAQAGSFVGVQAIQEFAGFFDSQVSPFLSSGPHQRAVSPYFLGTNKDGLCEILYAIKTEYTTDPDTTDREATIQVTSLMKVYVDFSAYVAEAHIYFAPGFLDFLFGQMLASERTQSFLCHEVLTNVCRGHVPKPMEDCSDALAALPGTLGETLAVDGDTQGCRAMYGVFALQNPKNHCPHVALDQIADPYGEFRCRESQEVAIPSLFSSSDLRFFQAFLNEHEMRPNMGFLEITE